MEDCFTKKVFGCRFCEDTFETQSGRSHHAAKKHPREHKKMKGHRKPPNYFCKYCFNGFGSKQSKWGHQQYCKSNPEMAKGFKAMRKANETLVSGVLFGSRTPH
jgi:hypothetical protein